MEKAFPLTVAVVTLNEERNLRRLLSSLGDLAREIVIIDSGSTDRTAEIAGEFGAKFETMTWSGFVAQKNHALDRSLQPWVLFLDADEELSPELAASLRDLFQRKTPLDCDAYWLNRRTWYLGAWIWHAWYPEWRLRLLRRGAGRWTGLDPHAKLAVEGRTARVNGDLLHYSFSDLADHLDRTLRYARTMAASYAKAGRPFRWHYLVFSPWVAFFKHFVIKGGWRDGWRGFLISMIRMIDVFAKYAFLLEQRLRQPRARMS